MRADGRFGGHIVQGHVDGIGKFLALDKIQGAQDFWLRIEIPPGLARYVISKGSLSIEGISLTVAEISEKSFAVWIIPHTKRHTNIDIVQAGDLLNIEFDILAKYVERMLARYAPQD